MGIIESITHKEEIQNLLDDAQTIYDDARKEFELQKARTTRSLEDLGKVKVSAWAEGMDSFILTFGAFKNIEMNRTTEISTHFVGFDEEPNQVMMNIERASMNANEVAKAGLAAVGTGALVGIAAYGGAMMFGTASTGTAIAALSGIAKRNATLAWFGGGAKAAGGLGMAGGKLVLAGVVVAPIIAVATIIAGAKGKERLAEAKKIHAEAENAVLQMNTIRTGLQGIAKMSDNYLGFIQKLNKEFAPFLKELKRIKNKHTTDQNGLVDFDSLSAAEQKTLHLSWLMAQIYYHVLSTPILTSQGEVSENAAKTLSDSRQELKQIHKELSNMVGEYASVGNIIWQPKAKRMIIISSIAVIVFAVVGVLSMGNSVIKGALYLACAAVSCPIVFKSNNITAKKKFIQRLVRLVVAILFMIMITVLL